MSQLLKNTLLASAFAAYSVSGFAATTLDTAAFSVEPLWPGLAMDLKLVSNQNNTYQIAIPTLAISPAGNSAYYSETALSTSVTDGYRITSLSVSGIVSANAWVETGGAGWENCTGCSIVGIQPAEASSSGYAQITLSQGGIDSVLEYNNNSTALSGATASFQLTYTQPIANQFSLSLWLAGGAFDRLGEIHYSTPSGDVYYTLGASSYFELRDIVVTMQVEQIAAVPEPSTYGMLLGGLGILGFAARRRKA